MIWILALHIAMMLCWCASLLYLLSLIASAGLPHKSHLAPGTVSAQDEQQALPLLYRHQESLARFLFTLVATPAGLAAIASGTGVFLVNQTIDPWLILKMTLVALLVAGHAITGGLVLRLEAGATVRMRAISLIFALGTLMVLIVWIVLAKPESGADLWGS